MAATITTTIGIIAELFVKNTDAVASAVDANVTTGASSSIFLIDVDNTLNTSAVYFKAVNATSATVGTTTPVILFKVPASTRLSMSVSSTATVTLGTGVSFWVSTDAGTGAAPSGTNLDPSNNVTVRLLLDT